MSGPLELTLDPSLINWTTTATCAALVAGYLGAFAFWFWTRKRFRDARGECQRACENAQAIHEDIDRRFEEFDLELSQIRDVLPHPGEPKRTRKGRK